MENRDQIYVIRFLKNLAKHVGISYLLEISQALVLSPHHCRHPSQRRPLQLLASVQRVAKLEQPHVILGHRVYQVPRSVDLPQGQLVVILK